MTLKQAILKLLQIDKRWEISKDNSHLGHGQCEYGLSINNINFNTIEDYHAAAKTFGYEIWYLPCSWNGKYFGLYAPNNGEQIYAKHKHPSAAIRAAFIEAVKHKLESTK